MASQDPDHGLGTRATYRSLLVRGFTPGEAANLTAYLCGLEVGQGRPWRLADVDRLLFLRELCRSGRLGADDGLGTTTIPRPAGRPKREPAMRKPAGAKPAGGSTAGRHHENPNATAGAGSA